MTSAITLVSRKKVMLCFGILLSALLVGLYIFQLNYLTQLAYHIAETEEQLTQIKYANAALQAETFQTMSLADLEQLALQENFEKVGAITYVRVSDPAVAQQ